MKFKIFTMLVILGILSVMPMIYMGKFDPIAMLDSAFAVAKTETDSLKVKIPDTLTDVVEDKKVQVYKWRDENGVMQFSNTPPPELQSEQIIVNTDSNLMKAVKIEEKKESEKEKVVQAVPSNPYSAKKMKKVMEDAKGVEELLQKRHEQQQEMLNNI